MDRLVRHYWILGGNSMKNLPPSILLRCRFINLLLWFLFDQVLSLQSQRRSMTILFNLMKHIKQVNIDIRMIWLIINMLYRFLLWPCWDISWLDLQNVWLTSPSNRKTVDPIIDVAFGMNFVSIWLTWKSYSTLFVRLLSERWVMVSEYIGVDIVHSLNSISAVWYCRWIQITASRSEIGCHLAVPKPALHLLDLRTGCDIWGSPWTFGSWVPWPISCIAFGIARISASKISWTCRGACVVGCWRTPSSEIHSASAPQTVIGCSRSRLEPEFGTFDPHNPRNLIYMQYQIPLQKRIEDWNNVLHYLSILVGVTIKYVPNYIQLMRLEILTLPR